MSIFFGRECSVTWAVSCPGPYRVGGKGGGGGLRKGIRPYRGDARCTGGLQGSVRHVDAAKCLQRVRNLPGARRE
jgi:hypothetical protein